MSSRAVLHSSNAVFAVAGHMKPGAGIDKGGIPALKNIVGIKQIGLQVT